MQKLESFDLKCRLGTCRRWPCYIWEVFKFIINAGMISPKASNSFMPIVSVNRIELAITPTIGTASNPIPETDAGKI